MRAILILLSYLSLNTTFANDDIKLYRECQKLSEARTPIFDRLKSNVEESKSISPYACINFEQLDSGLSALNGTKPKGMKNTPAECDQKNKNESEYNELKAKLDATQTEWDICGKFVNDMKIEKKRCLEVCKSVESILYSKKCRKNLCKEAE